MSEQDYYSKQIITYLGNKRKFISKIDEVIKRIKQDLGKEKINIGEGFSGSGVVSRLFKNRVNGGNFFVNDISSYSKILNECYLTDINELTEAELVYLQETLSTMKKYVKINNTYEPFISKYWAPKDDNNILPNERVYFTRENAVMIDKMMYFIKNNIGKEYQKFFIAPLIVQASTNNNTNGQFSAYFKDENKEIQK